MTMDTVASCLKRAGELTVTSDTPRLDVELLLCHVLQKDRAYLYTWPQVSLSADQVAAFESVFQRRKIGEPIAHIIGEREFWSLPFYVNSSTLIPRPDTELLVETVLQLVHPSSRILDLGTGTGAIALALASELPQAKIIAVDKTPSAVALAQRNRQRLGLDNVEVMQSDWFAAIGVQHFDVIVSNPPYIDAADAHLKQGDLRFEPASALVADEGGLADIRLIIANAKTYLARDGLMLVEHGWQQAEQVQDCFVGHGYRKIETRKDLGGNDRVTMGWLLL